MRPWIADQRAFKVYSRWLKSPLRRTGDGYTDIEHWRQWVYLTSGHFFDVLGHWREDRLWPCCEALGLPPPLPMWEESHSEDELICARKHEDEAY